MDVQTLWNDHTFHILLEDLFKARKSQTLGPVRLQAIMDYVDRKAATMQAPEPRAVSRTMPRQTLPGERGSQAGFILEESEDEGEDLAASGVAVPGSAQGYLEARRSERKDPQASLGEAADIVQKAIKGGQWGADGSMQVRIPKRMVVSGLEAILKKERRVAFTQLTVSLPPKNQEINKNVKGMSKEAAEKISGSQGEKTGDWVVVITK